MLRGLYETSMAAKTFRGRQPDLPSRSFFGCINKKLRSSGVDRPQLDEISRFVHSKLRNAKTLKFLTPKKFGFREAGRVTLAAGCAGHCLVIPVPRSRLAFEGLRDIC